MQSITKYLSTELKLTVNQTKSQVVKLREASFLGFEIVRAGIWWTEKSRKKFKDRIREPERSGDRLSAGQPEG